MKVTLQYAERQARYFTKLVERLRQTSDASDTKEKETGKEKFPPDPLLEKRGKEEKAAAAAAARACEGKYGNPSYAEVEEQAAADGISHNFAKAWFDRMNRENPRHKWVHPSSGKPIGNWRRYLVVCWKRRDEFDDAG